MNPIFKFEDREEGGLIYGDFKMQMSIERKRDEKVQFSVYYIFLMHYFGVKTTPVEPGHPYPYPAPFVLTTRQTVVHPAYLIRQGKIHYGYQLTTVNKIEKIHFEAQVYNKIPIFGNNKVEDYEVLRFHLYDESGSMIPTNYLDIVAYYSTFPRYLRAPFARLNYKPEIPLPYPLNQSPMFFEQTNISIHPINRFAPTILSPILPSKTSVGNYDATFLGDYLPSKNNKISQVSSVIIEPYFQLSVKLKRTFLTLSPGANIYADHWKLFRQSLVSPLYQLTILINQDPHTESQMDSRIKDSRLVNLWDPNKREIGVQTDLNLMQQWDNMRTILASMIKFFPMLLRETDDEKKLRDYDQVKDSKITFNFLLKRIQGIGVVPDFICG